MSQDATVGRIVALRDAGEVRKGSNYEHDVAGDYQFCGEAL